MPYNFILGQPMNLNGPSVDGGLPGEMWIENENGQFWLRYSYVEEDIRRNRGVKLGYFQPWDSSATLAIDNRTNEFYSDETNRKLLALRELLGFAISMYEISYSSELQEIPSWPFTEDGRNPVTNAPLKMGTNPGEYYVALEERNGNIFLVYNVIGKDGKPIPNPSVKVSSKEAGGT